MGLTDASSGVLSCAVVCWVSILPTSRPLQGAMSRTPPATVVATKGAPTAWPLRTPPLLPAPLLVLLLQTWRRAFPRTDGSNCPQLLPSGSPARGYRRTAPFPGGAHSAGRPHVCSVAVLTCEATFPGSAGLAGWFTGCHERHDGCACLCGALQRLPSRLVLAGWSGHSSAAKSAATRRRPMFWSRSN